MTISVENKDDQVNVGVEWFVPKYKRQQRSSSIHSEYTLTPSTTTAAAVSSSVENQQREPNRIRKYIRFHTLSVLFE